MGNEASLNLGFGWNDFRWSEKLSNIWHYYITFVHVWTLQCNGKRERERGGEREGEREILNTLVFCHHEITLGCFPS